MYAKKKLIFPQDLNKWLNKKVRVMFFCVVKLLKVFTFGKNTKTYLFTQKKILKTEKLHLIYELEYLSK